MEKPDAIPVVSTSTMPQEPDPNPTASPGHKPLSLWPGMYRSPVTAALWNAKSSILERTWNLPLDGPPPQHLLTRNPSESRLSVTYNFSTDIPLREQYRSAWNGIKIGKLLEDLDALAGTISMKHCSDDDSTTRPLLLVTACVDKISLKKPLRLDIDLKLGGAVAWVGHSSMQIRMEVIQPVGEDSQVAMVANFTFVARDSKTRKAVPINRLQPETDEEKELFSVVEQQSKRRKMLRVQQQEVANGVKSASNEDRLQALLAEGRVLLELPALADRNSILIKDTQLENTFICQPQQRNLHGRIFGGFLMRRAYELAFSTCYVFGGHRPIFLEVDHVDFLRAVDVGDMLRFKSCVLYTEEENSGQPKIHVEVVAVVTRPEFCSSQVSNTFYFTFTIDLTSGNHRVHRVLPGTEEEARRCIARYDADHCT